MPNVREGRSREAEEKRRRANGEGTVYKRRSTYTARVIFGYETRPDGRVKAIKRDVGGFKTMREAYSKIPEIRAEGIQKSPVHGVDYSNLQLQKRLNKA